MKLIASSFYRTKRMCGDGSYIRAICYSIEGVREQESFDVRHGLFVMRGKNPGGSVFLWDPDLSGVRKIDLYDQITFAF